MPIEAVGVAVKLIARLPFVTLVFDALNVQYSTRTLVKAVAVAGALIKIVYGFAPEAEELVMLSELAPVLSKRPLMVTFDPAIVRILVPKAEVMARAVPLGLIVTEE